MIHTEPSATAIAGQGLATPPVVYEVDRYSNLETGDNSTVISAAPSTGSAQLTGTTASLKGGVATFTSLADDTAGTIALDFSGGGLNAGPSNSIVVRPAVASQLVIHAQPSATAIAGQALASEPVIYEEDPYGNLETGDNSTVVTASLASGIGPLLGTTSATVKGGVADVTGLADDRAETITLELTSENLATATTHTIAVGPAAANELVIHTQPSATATAGQPLATQPVIYEEDQYGNLETGDNSTVVTASLASGAGPLQGTTIATVKGGAATFMNLADNRAETIALELMSGSLAVATANPILVSPASASALVIHTQPSATATAGEALSTQPVIYEEDRFGNLETGDSTTTITAAPSTGSAQIGGTTATVSGGVAAFTGLAVDTARTLAIQFSGSGQAVGTSNSLVVTPAAAAQLVIASQPSPNAVAGQAFTTQPVIDEEDRFGNFETGDDITVVAVSLPSGTGALRGTTAVAVVGGVATFTDLAEDAAGSIALEFSSGSVSGATSDAINVAPAPATRLVVTSPPPASVAPGAAFGLVVTAEDAFDNVATAFGGPVTVSLASGAGGSLGGTPTVTASGGVATFSGLSLDKVGAAYTLQAAASGLASVTTPPVDVKTGILQIVVTLEPPPTVIAGVPFGLTAKVEDSLGNVVTGYDGAIGLSLVGGPPGAMLGGTSTINVVNGVASFAGLNVDQAGGGYALAVSGPGLTATTTGALGVLPGAVTHLVVTGQPQSVVAGSDFNLAVAAEDAYGNVNPDFDGSVAVSVATNPGQGALGGANTVFAVHGLAGFNLSLSSAGAGYTLLAASPGVAGAVTRSIDVSPTVTGTGENSPSAIVTIIGEDVRTTGRGKHRRPVGFELVFSQDLKPSGPLNLGDFAVSQQVKHHRKTISQAVVLQSASMTSTNTVTLMLSGKPRFARGGQIVVKSPTEAPITDAQGDRLGGRTVFTILPGARGVE